MDRGAFVVLDCLGFKGLWEKVEDPESVLTILKEIDSNKDDIIKQSTLSQYLPFAEWEIQIACFSDTVVCGVTSKELYDDYEDHKTVVEGMTVYAATLIASAIAKRFRELSVPLLMRGCIVHGEFSMSGNFFIGPAVDLGARLMNEAEGAFIWLEPMANDLCRAFMKLAKSMMLTPEKRRLAFESAKVAMEQSAGMKGFDWEKLNARQITEIEDVTMKMVERIFEHVVLIWDFAIPMKQEKVIQTSVVSLIAPIDGSGLEEQASRILMTFDVDTPDVQVKRTNTLALINRGTSEETATREVCKATTESIRRIATQSMGR